MILTVFVMVPGLAGQNGDVVKTLFLDNPLTGSRYNPDTGKVYGIFRSKEIQYIATVDVETGKLNLLDRLQEKLKFPTGATALDIRGGRYFFIGTFDKKYNLYVYDMTAGVLLNKHELKNRLALTEYHRKTGKLYGFQKINSHYRFVSFAADTEKTVVIGKYPALSRLMSQSRKIDTKHNSLIFEGKYKEKTMLLSIGLRDGRIKRLDALKISTNEFRVYKFGKNQGRDRLYTLGADNCTVIAGYCRNTGTGFLAHFSPRYKKTAEAFRRIDRAIKTMGGKGLAHISLSVAGGRYRYPISLENALSIYRELEQTYKCSYKGDRQLHLGLSYGVIINNGGIEIFTN